MITYVARRGSGARWGTMGTLAFVGLLAGALCFVAAPRQATHSLLLPDYDYSAAVGSGPFPWEEPFVSPSWPVVDIRIPDFGSLFQSSPPSPPPPLARARLMDWTMAFISVDTHTEVPVNVQIGDTAQKQALDATVDLTKTAVAGSQGYVAADGFVPAHASSSGSGGRLGDEIGAGGPRALSDFPFLPPPSVSALEGFNVYREAAQRGVRRGGASVPVRGRDGLLGRRPPLPRRVRRVPLDAPHSGRDRLRRRRGVRRRRGGVGVGRLRLGLRLLRLRAAGGGGGPLCHRHRQRQRAWHGSERCGRRRRREREQQGGPYWGP